MSISAFSALKISVSARPSSARPAIPFFPHRVVGQHLDVDAADDRARLKATLFGVARVEPVGERDAARRLVDEAIDRTDKGTELVFRIGERRRPYDPVELRVGLAVVERQPKAVLLRPVESKLAARDLRREQTRAEQLVPDDIIP